MLALVLMILLVAYLSVKKGKSYWVVGSHLSIRTVAMVAQLNSDGSLDKSLTRSEQISVRAMAFQLDESLLLAGEFTSTTMRPGCIGQG